MVGDDEGGRPKMTEAGKRQAAARQERLAAALRANLRRRKEQGRAREDGDPERPSGVDEPT